MSGATPAPTSTGEGEAGSDGAVDSGTADDATEVGDEGDETEVALAETGAAEREASEAEHPETANTAATTPATALPDITHQPSATTMGAQAA
jgi:hypothetical protein